MATLHGDFRKSLSYFYQQENHTAFFLLVDFSIRMNNRGRCWPSVNTLANELGCHRSTIIRAINMLVEIGAVRKVAIEERVGKEKKAYQSQNVYELQAKFVAGDEIISLLYVNDETADEPNSIVALDATNESKSIVALDATVASDATQSIKEYGINTLLEKGSKEKEEEKATLSPKVESGGKPPAPSESTPAKSIEIEVDLNQPVVAEKIEPIPVAIDDPQPIEENSPLEPEHLFESISEEESFNQLGGAGESEAIQAAAAPFEAIGRVRFPGLKYGADERKEILAIIGMMKKVRIWTGEFLDPDAQTIEDYTLWRVCIDWRGNDGIFPAGSMFKSFKDNFLPWYKDDSARDILAALQRQYPDWRDRVFSGDTMAFRVEAMSWLKEKPAAKAMPDYLYLIEGAEDLIEQPRNSRYDENGQLKPAARAQRDALNNSYGGNRKRSGFNRKAS